MSNYLKFLQKVLDNGEVIYTTALSNEVSLLPKPSSDTQLDKYRKERVCLFRNVYSLLKYKNWLLTAFEKKNDVISASSTDNETEPRGKQVDTAPLQNNVIPKSKDTTTPEERQEPDPNASGYLNDTDCTAIRRNNQPKRKHVLRVSSRGTLVCY